MENELQHRYVISGRVVDPLGLAPAEALLSLGYDRDGTGYGTSVPMTASGAFVTQVVYPGTYVLMLVRTPYSPTQPPMPVGLTVVQVGNQDLSGVVVTVRRDFAIQGRIRVEPAGTPPAVVHVSACLAHEGVRHAACRPVQISADGTFVLRNAFGLRFLEGPSPLRVFLDRKEITRMPTDFSTLGKANLEIVL